MRCSPLSGLAPWSDFHHPTGFCVELRRHHAGNIMNYPRWTIRHGLCEADYPNMRDEGGLVKDGAGCFKELFNNWLAWWSPGVSTAWLSVKRMQVFRLVGGFWPRISPGAARVQWKGCGGFRSTNSMFMSMLNDASIAKPGRILSRTNQSLDQIHWTRRRDSTYSDKYFRSSLPEISLISLCI